MKYLEVSIESKSFETWNDIFVSDLAEIGFESFQEDEIGKLKAYIRLSEFSEKELSQLFEKRKQQVNFNFEITVLEEQNWNSEWESQFSPVIVDGRLEIIAPFHKSEIQNGYSIIIEPKMTFGTGHHQTTHLICSYLLKSPPKKKSILDMGTGTGVLAILAEKLGAKFITAIEIEEWSVENARENIKRNGCSRIEVIKGSKEEIPMINFDCIIANINRNVLADQFSSYAKHICKGGDLIISGFFSTDNNYLIEMGENNGFQFSVSASKDEWSMIQFIKQ